MITFCSPTTRRGMDSMDMDQTDTLNGMATTAELRNRTRDYAATWRDQEFDLERIKIADRCPPWCGADRDRSRAY